MNTSLSPSPDIAHHVITVTYDVDCIGLAGALALSLLVDCLDDPDPWVVTYEAHRGNPNAHRKMTYKFFTGGGESPPFPGAIRASEVLKEE